LYLLREAEKQEVNVKKTKITAVVLAILCMAALESNANVDFQWTSGSGAATDQTGINTLANRTALLYVSSDAVIDLNTSVALQSTYGNDQFIGAVTVGLGGRYATAATVWGAAGAGAGSYVGMYTYMVLVNQAFTAGVTPGSIAGGTFYGISSIGQIAGVNTTLGEFDVVPAPSPQQFTDNDGHIQTSNANVAVPEPSTVALMLAGLGIVAMRMRRK